MIMRALILTPLCFFLALSTTFAQSDAPSGEVLIFQEDRLHTTLPVSLQDISPFLSVALIWETDGAAGTPLLRSQHADGSFSDWQALKPDPHATMEAPRYVSSLLYFPATTTAFEIDFIGTESNFLDGELHLFNPGDTPERSSTGTPLETRVECPCPQPDYEGRLDWCPNGDCPQDPTPEPTDVTHIIVHHSAGVNSSNDWPAVVRSIWNYHVNTNGWDDIGYNWLVDPNGVLYEGRGDGLQGAHFCGQNGNTVGLCVLGNFQTTLPSGAALGKLREYLAWQTCDLGVDPTDFGFHDGSGLNLYYISGHRDGCSTACPGDQFYPEFPALRESVQAFIDNGCMAVEEPIELTATALSSSSVQLNWNADPNVETGYEIERSADTPTAFTWIASVNSSTTTFLDTGLDPGEYYYRVRRFGPSGTGTYSNEAYVNTETVGTEDRWQPAEILLSPNPFSEQLDMHLHDPFVGEIRFELLSIDGKLVQDLGTTNKVTEVLDMSWSIDRLPAGIYLLRGSSPAGQFITQVIRQ